MDPASQPPNRRPNPFVSETFRHRETPAFFRARGRNAAVGVGLLCFVGGVFAYTLRSVSQVLGGGGDRPVSFLDAPRPCPPPGRLQDVRRAWHQAPVVKRITLHRATMSPCACSCCRREAMPMSPPPRGDAAGAAAAAVAGVGARALVLTWTTLPPPLSATLLLLLLLLFVTSVGAQLDTGKR